MIYKKLQFFSEIVHCHSSMILCGHSVILGGWLATLHVVGGCTKFIGREMHCAQKPGTEDLKAGTTLLKYLLCILQTACVSISILLHAL